VIDLGVMKTVATLDVAQGAAGIDFYGDCYPQITQITKKSA
jgi:hypothetical protein